jgi:hypothetical protein
MSHLDVCAQNEYIIRAEKNITHAKQEVIQAKNEVIKAEKNVIRAELAIRQAKCLVQDEHKIRSFGPFFEKLDTVHDDVSADITPEKPVHHYEASDYITIGNVVAGRCKHIGKFIEKFTKNFPVGASSGKEAGLTTSLPKGSTITLSVGMYLIAADSIKDNIPFEGMWPPQSNFSSEQLAELKQKNKLWHLAPVIVGDSVRSMMTIALNNLAHYGGLDLLHSLHLYDSSGLRSCAIVNAESKVSLLVVASNSVGGVNINSMRC